jgi:multiple sugar transport system permease protein
MYQKHDDYHWGSRGVLLRKQLLPYAFILPVLLVVLVVLVYPLVRGVYLSFTHYNLLTNLLTSEKPVWIGLKNYANLLSDVIFSLSLRTTVLWTLTVVSGQYVIGFVLALLLNTRFRGRGLFRSLILVPWIVPSIAAALAWIWIYDQHHGVLNVMLRQLGMLRGENIAWLGSSTWLALIAVCVAGIWKGVPFMTIVLLAGMQSIPVELYEASRIDGARLRQVVRYIIIPHLKTISAITILLSTIWTFNHFDLVYIMTKGGPAHATHILSIHTYLTAFSEFEMGYAAAIAGVLLVIMIAIMALYFWVAHREE